MLTVTDQRFAQGPAGMRRRDFLRIGSLGGLALPGLLATRSQAAMDRNVFKNKSVVFLFLQGGPPQIETFDPHEPYFTHEKHKSLYPHRYEGGTYDWPEYRPLDQTDRDAIEHVRYEYAADLSLCDEHLVTREALRLDTLDELLDDAAPKIAEQPHLP